MLCSLTLNPLTILIIPSVCQTPFGLRFAFLTLRLEKHVNTQTDTQQEIMTITISSNMDVSEPNILKTNGVFVFYSLIIYPKTKVLKACSFCFPFLQQQVFTVLFHNEIL